MTKNEIKFLIKKYKQGNYSLIDIYYYIQGSIRTSLYYSKYKWLIRKHIQEQYEFRLAVSKTECNENNSCIGCGCTMPDVLFANKQCKNNCYPKMKSWFVWKHLKKEIATDKIIQYIRNENNSRIKGIF